jgi:TonB family protein
LAGSRFETSIRLAQFRNHLEPSKALGNVLAPYRDNGKRISIGDSTTRVNPHCSYMPNPPYTEQARAHKISGIILVDATVTKDGRIEDLLLSRGLAYGLDENALKTVSTWRCSPAMLDGKPCPIRVQFEVSFKLY